jgi:hypothetical protein
MEDLFAYLENNKEGLAEWGLTLSRAVIGTVLSGLTFGCFYFMYFLYGVLRLEKGSREYYQLREHIMTESLLRYGITIGCILTIDVLIFIFFPWGSSALLMGALVVAAIYALKYVAKLLKQRKVKQI